MERYKEEAVKEAEERGRIYELIKTARKYKIEEIQQKDGNYLQVQVIETNSLESRSTYKVLFKKVISESGVSYELVG